MKVFFAAVPTDPLDMKTAYLMAFIKRSTDVKHHDHQFASDDTWMVTRAEFQLTMI